VKRIAQSPINAVVVLALGLYLCPAMLAQQLALTGVPGKLAWKNSPSASHIEAGRELKISAGEKTDWFVDPFDGEVHNNAPLLLFTPGHDYVLSAKLSVDFHSKWDAGAFMVWADDHHWAKLSFELSPDKQPTMVTVVTRGASDDCNSFSVSSDTVFLQIARTGSTYVFYSSTNGNDWKILRTFSLDTNLEQKVGFEAQSPAGTGADVTFSEIHYTPSKIKNIYTGQ
jgi:regulation of enolase protein 1 (concanavalin A-like superfamily)